MSAGTCFKAGAGMSDFIEVVDAAYRPAADEAAWLGGVVEAANPLLDTGLGTAGFTYDASAEDWITLRQVVAPGVDPSLLHSLFHTPHEPGEATRTFVRLFRSATVASAFEANHGLHPVVLNYFREVAEQARLGDLRFVNATDPSQIGCMLVVLHARKRQRAHQVPQWRRVAAHIAAGLRVHRRFAGPAEGEERTEAILRPDGRVEHAEPVAQGQLARRALKEASGARDTARGPLRHDDEAGALNIWEGLVAGRWSLVDHIDTDGRRFVLARRNDPDAPDIRGLTLRERQVISYAAQGHANKLIAYQLGLSTSTVSGHLARARQKLGLQSMDAIRTIVGDAKTVMTSDTSKRLSPTSRASGHPRTA